MSFDLNTWKDKLSARLPGWKERMTRAGVTSTYAFLSAAALWPVVEAARSGDWAAVGAAAALTASSLGTNLLANQIQGWKDESDAARQLEQAAGKDAALRAELDVVLEQFKVLPLAEQRLGQADRAWFSATIQQELKRLGSGVKYQAAVIGDGVAIQGKNNIGVGPGGVYVGGSVAGDVLGVGGSINTGTVNIFYTQYQSPAGRAELTRERFERILQEYLEWVVRAYGKARLYGLESARATRAQPRRQLADVFVPISLRRYSPPSRDEVEERISAYKQDPLAHQRAYLRAIEAHREEGEHIELSKLLTLKPRLAVIGSAGSGKSTLAAYLAASLAEAALRGTKPSFSLPKDRSQLLPVVIPLRYYREYQNLCHASPQERLKNPRAGTLAGLIPWYLRRRSPALELSEDFFDRLLLGGGCLLALDGLDEVVNRAERGRVRAEVEQIANDIYPGNLILVTARESGYREDAVFGDDFTRLEVQPLADEQIAALVQNWSRQLYPEAVQKQADEIIAAIRDINRRYQEQKQPPLISTPLMTTMVVSVKWGENELPRERARLYEAAVKVILQAQYLESDQAQQELVNWGGTWDEQRQWLSYLALEMMRGGRDGAVIPEERVRAILSACPEMTPGKLDTFIQALRLRGGLFEERAELFQFAHLTFQEYLAARLLVKQRQDGLKKLSAAVAAPWWREVLLLLYGFAKEDYPPFAAHYLDWLGTLTPDEQHLAGLELAAAAVLEIERPDPVIRQVQAERLVSDIANQARQTSPTLRARAGDTLAKLGDPRAEVTTCEGMAFCYVPAGEFIYGDQKKKLTLDEFWIGKYPVTNAQYGQFVAAGGYQNPVYWQTAVEAQSWTPRGFKGSWDQKPRQAPVDFGEPFNLSNHPVVGVSWYEAAAFCQWLTEKGGAWGQSWQGSDMTVELQQRLKQGKWQVSLPEEAQWEKAARGVDGREYPWGDDFDVNRANTDETGIGSTSAVGSFPGGQSPYGLWDASGNVWEWMMSEEGSARVLRGGAFYRDAGGARCAYRLRDSPGLRGRLAGFRVVLSPLLR